MNPWRYQIIVPGLVKCEWDGQYLYPFLACHIIQFRYLMKFNGLLTKHNQVDLQHVGSALGLAGDADQIAFLIQHFQGAKKSSLQIAGNIRVVELRTVAVHLSDPKKPAT